MAKNAVCQKLIRNLPSYFTRRLNSAPPAISPLNLVDKPDPVPANPPFFTPTFSDGDRKILNLEDSKELFSSVSTTKLIKSAATLHMASMEPVVDIGTWVMNSMLMEIPVLRKIVLEAAKHTFFEHFCAGENLDEVANTISELQCAGLKGMLDYGLEHANDNQSCDANFAEFIHTIDSTKSLPPSSVSFVVVKITAICPPSLLRRVSDLLRWEYKDNSMNLPWKIKSLPVLTDSSPLYHTLTRPEALSPEEERDLELAHQRLNKICERCMEVNVPLLLDAEDTSIQPAIDYLNYSAAVKYHKGEEGPLVFGTIQAYLKDAKERMVEAQKAAEKMGVPMGFKLVRGAYMSSERLLMALAPLSWPPTTSNQVN